MNTHVKALKKIPTIASLWKEYGCCLVTKTLQTIGSPQNNLGSIHSRGQKLGSNLPSANNHMFKELF